MENIKIVEKNFGKSLEIEQNEPMWKMAVSMPNTILKLSEFLDENEIQRQKTPYSRYVNIDYSCFNNNGFFSNIANMCKMMFGKMNYFIGFAIEGQTKENEDIKEHEFSSKKYLFMKHIGAYKALGNSYRTIYQYAQKEDYELSNEAIEVYISDPRETKEEELITEIYMEIK